MEWGLLAATSSDRVCARKSGLWSWGEPTSFPKDPDNSTFEFLKPGEVWRFTGTAMQRMSRLVVQRVLKATAWECSAFVLKARSNMEGAEGGKEWNLMREAIEKWPRYENEKERGTLSTRGRRPDGDGSRMCPDESSWGSIWFWFNRRVCSPVPDWY